MFRESWGARSDVRTRGVASRGQQMGRMTRVGVLWTRCACSHLSSWVPPTRREREREEGVRGKEWWPQPGCGQGGQEQHTHAGRSEAGGGRTCACSSDTAQRQARTGKLGQQHARGVRTCSYAPDVRALVSPKLTTAWQLKASTLTYNYHDQEQH
jgi:hypothetical protein